MQKLSYRKLAIVEVSVCLCPSGYHTLQFYYNRAI